jgi:hypothetical protein
MTIDFTRKTESAPSHASIINNNNNAKAAPNEIRLEAATDTEEFTQLTLSGEGPLEARHGFGRALPEQVLEEMDNVALRGRNFRSNTAERENVIELGLLKANTTSMHCEPLYRASLTDNSIRWFAGQDHVVADPTVQWVQSRSNVEGDPASRLANPLIESTILDADHALVTFLDKFGSDLPGKEQGMRPLHTDRADTRVRYYSVDRPLLDQARLKILYTVYAQMYYTQLRDCHLKRLVESEQGETALVLRIAEQWGLAVNPATKAVSDWGPDAYRPSVVITLRIRYTVVNGVASSAASLYKTRTRLVPATGTVK